MPKAKNSDRARLIMAKYLVLVSAYMLSFQIAILVLALKTNPGYKMGI